MNATPFQQYFQLILFLAYVIPAIFFLLTQQRILELIHPLNRKIPPAQVWLQLIPVFNLIWQFYVIVKISDSIRHELNIPLGDSIFSYAVFQNDRPAYNSGILYAFLFCLNFVHLPSLLNAVVSLITIGIWVFYWVELSRYKKKLKHRSLFN